MLSAMPPLRLTECEGLNYNGFIEGNHLFSGRSDVIVCDGFVGNIALKSCEGLATLIVEQMRETLNSHWLYRWFFRFCNDVPTSPGTG